jgi:CubicO group peptidase (beta-lactamase class C family)
MHPHQPGLATLRLNHDTAPEFHVAGCADVLSGVPVATDTAFRLASLSKQFTAFAALSLAWRGVLSLDAPISRWFAAAPPSWQAITPWHLIGHRAGLADYEDHLPALPHPQLRDADIPRLIAAIPPWFAAGSAWRYSNTGYCLLALILEHVADRPFAEVLAGEIFVPLGMAARTWREGDPPLPRRARGHCRHAGQYHCDDQNLTSGTFGDGGIYASVDDLARWLGELMAPRIVPAALVRQALTALGPADGGASYAAGWFRSADGTLAHHTGETIGFRNAVVWHVVTGRAAVVLTNRDDAQPLPLAHDMLAG